MISLTLLGSSCQSCKPPYQAPDVEICISNGNGTAECTDKRINQSYTNPNTTNYICTNPKDYATLYDDRAGLREKLIKCESKRK